MIPHVWNGLWDRSGLVGEPALEGCGREAQESADFLRRDLAAIGPGIEGRDADAQEGCGFLWGEEFFHGVHLRLLATVPDVAR